MNSLVNWVGERLPVSGRQFKELTNEPVPYHLKRWWFALGGTPAYLFIVQIFTGILLAFYYSAAPETAYESVRVITEDVAFGWFIVRSQTEAMRNELIGRLRVTAILLSDTIDLAREQPDECRSHVRLLGQRTGTRLTVVAVDGRVLADSAKTSLAEVTEMDNHRDRPELRQAAERGSGQSATIGLVMDSSFAGPRIR